MAIKNDKSLGQHWLKDRDILDQIAFDAEIEDGDFVLEVGPGLGTLTSSLLKFAGSGKVLSIEFDSQLAKKLPAQFPGKNLEVLNQDFLQFDLNSLPNNYKVAANVPYYITSKIIEKLLTAENKPAIATLLVQKEVAERLAAKPGQLSILAISAQIYCEVSLGEVVGKEFFTPPPKVDSQVVILRILPENKLSIFNKEKESNISEKQLFRVIKAGFTAKRKKISTSLSSNLVIPKDEILTMLAEAKISPEIRSQELSIEDWLNLAKIIFSTEV
jgi:16S rRNA (adenine1518-N6/adenine1519-N6)-dimethyltransferase